MNAAVRLLLATAVSALLLGLLFHLVSGSAGRPELLPMLRAAVPGLIGGYLVCTLAQTWLRALRYRVLLRASGEANVPTRFHIFIVSLARNMMVDLLPARLGELAYIGLLNRGYRVGAPACVSSMAISFVFDLVALLAIVAGLCFVAFSRWMPVVLLGLALLVGAGLAVLFGGWRWIRKIERLDRMMARFADAFERTRAAGVAGRVFALSLGVRFFKYSGFYAMFLAVTIPTVPHLAAVPAGRVLVTLLSAEAAASLPIPTFMSFGAYEAGGTAAWTALGATAAEAAMTMLAVHVGSQVVDYTLGALGLLLITLTTRAGSVAGRARAGALALAALGVLATAAYAWKERRELKKQGSLIAPESGHAVAPVGTTPAPGPKGFIVWSSNRSGNHDLWMQEMPAGEPRRLTTHPNTETYPRISPDGRRILFSRAHRTWVSQRNERDWDTYLLDLDSGDERWVASNAFMATWLDDASILFQGVSISAVRLDLATGERSVVAQAGSGGVPPGVALQTPSYNPASRALAVTFRGAMRATALVDEHGTVRRVGGGCQLFWSFDGARLFYVDSGGRMKNAFYLVDPGTLARALWFDAPEPWSHEYFPKESNDGKWLVYGAAAEGHEHDTADYEIFLWPVGAPADAARRITWHTGNDCWPDIHVHP